MPDRQEKTVYVTSSSGKVITPLERDYNVRNYNAKSYNVKSYNVVVTLLLTRLLTWKSYNAVITRKSYNVAIT